MIGWWSWWLWLVALAVMWTGAVAAPRRALGHVRDVTLDFRQGVARSIVSIYGKCYHELQVWLLDAGLPGMGV